MATGTPLPNRVLVFLIRALLLSKGPGKSAAVTYSSCCRTLTDMSCVTTKMFSLARARLQHSYSQIAVRFCAALLLFTAAIVNSVGGKKRLLPDNVWWTWTDAKKGAGRRRRRRINICMQCTAFAWTSIALSIDRGREGGRGEDGMSTDDRRTDVSSLHACLPGR